MKPLARRDALSGFSALVLGVACAADEDGPGGASGGSPRAGGGSPGNGGNAHGGATASMSGSPSINDSGRANSPVAGSTAGGSTGASAGDSAGTAAGGSAGAPQTGSAGTGLAGSASGGSASGGVPGNDAGAGGRISGGASQGGRAQGGMAGGGPAGGSAGQSGLIVPDFGATPMCTLSPTDAAREGPFFVHDDEVMTDIPLGRPDIREQQEGVEFQLYIRVLDQSKSCNSPIAGVEVYIWHTNALGFYSGFNDQDPNRNYMGSIERTVENSDRFCRGKQITSAEGIVSFRTLYPGWYFGRPLHVHFLALKPGSGADTMSYRGSQYHVFTTQFYFDDQFSRNIHENYRPYTTRASGSGYEQYVKADTRNPIRPSLKLDGDVVIGTLNIITSSTESRR
jgi:protocatechuate 3,4-dioxygenase beta subunit